MPLEGSVKPGQVVDSLVQRGLALLQRFSDFSNFHMRETHLWVLLRCRFRFSRWGLRFCISDQPPNNANAAAVQTTLRVKDLQGERQRQHGVQEKEGPVSGPRPTWVHLNPDPLFCVSTAVS